MVRFYRYLIVGLISNASIYALYLIVTYAGLEPKVAMSFVYLMGTIVSYIGNRNWSFKHTGKLHQSLLRYAFAHLIGYFINLSLLVIFVDRLGYPHQVVQLFAGVVVAVYLFFTFKYFVFPAQNQN